jgi:hypothetical protein
MAFSPHCDVVCRLPRSDLLIPGGGSAGKGYDENHIWDWCYYSTGDAAMYAGDDSSSSAFVCEIDLPAGTLP